MRKSHLILDVPYLGYVSFFSTRKNDFNANQVAANMISEIRRIVNREQCVNVLFCFDGKWPLHRRVMFKGYKAGRQTNRESMDPVELARLDEFRVFMWSLPERLRKCGLAVACQPGYEADDMIAEAVIRIKPEAGDSVVIVTSDEDMFQCLRAGVVMYTPTAKEKHRDAIWLMDTYGVTHEQWATVKSIAGCESDGVPGISGVGNKTACKFLAGKLPEKSKAHQSILENMTTCESTLPLVKIPWPHATLPDGWLSEDQEWSDRKASLLVSEIMGQPEEAGDTPPPF